MVFYNEVSEDVYMPEEKSLLISRPLVGVHSLFHLRLIPPFSQKSSSSKKKFKEEKHKQSLSPSAERPQCSNHKKKASEWASIPKLEKQSHRKDKTLVN